MIDIVETYHDTSLHSWYLTIYLDFANNTKINMKIKPQNIKLIIVAPIAELCAELEERFAGIESVSIVNDRITKISSNTIV